MADKPPASGDNSKVAVDHIRSYLERIERLNEEIKVLGDDKRDVYAEAKALGFDVKALKTIIQLRAKDPAQRQEENAILETYMKALGMLD